MTFYGLLKNILHRRMVISISQFIVWSKYRRYAVGCRDVLFDVLQLLALLRE